MEIKYTIQITFTAEQLQAIYATGNKLIFAKASANGGSPDVVWQSIRPMQNNTIQWLEEYGIYATKTEIAEGAIIERMSQVNAPAARGKLYTLTPTGAMEGPSDGGFPKLYTAENDYAEASYINLGLTQDAEVNGTTWVDSAINIAPTLRLSKAVFKPYFYLYMWLQDLDRQQIIMRITAPMTKIDYGILGFPQEYAYDSATGTFLPSGSNAAAADFVSYLPPED